MARCTIVSFRLGLTDGVSAVARIWQNSLEELGWEVETLAGDGPVDQLVPELSIGAGVTVEAPLNHDKLVHTLERGLDGVDLVVAENILSIPLNLAASRVLIEVLGGRPAILHHHDPPWQRQRFAHVTELPPDDPCWRHVTINRLTQREFADRGLDATTIYNGFDMSSGNGDRDGMRHWLGLGDDDPLFVHPVRAIARKNVPEAVRVAAAFEATYWLPGPAEEGYQSELEEILSSARCRIERRPLPPERSMADLYAACDLVLFPSTWEGFGNPPIEAAIHGRPVVVGDYPVADELRQLGFRWLDPADLDAISEALEAQRSLPHGDITVDVAHNRRIVEHHLTTAATTRAISRLLGDAGWVS